MQIKARQKEGIIILDIVGRIDVDSATFVEVVGQCLRDGYSDILCNLEEVDFIDYMGVSVVVIAYKEVANHHGRLRLTNVPAHVRNMLCVAGIDKVIEIYATEDLALVSFREDTVIENIKKMQLRRRFKRLPVDIKVEVRPKYGAALACQKVDILNVSGIGAYIYGCANFKLGDEVVVRLKLQPKPEEIELEAKVVWLPDKQVQHRFYPGMGVEFQNIPGSVQQKLIEFIDRNFSYLSQDDNR